MAGVINLICPTGPAEYFCAEGWTGFVDLPVELICRTRSFNIALARGSDSPAAALAKLTGNT
jgi:hypothetical protein